MIATIRRVLQGEGVASATRRSSERIAESAGEVALRLRAWNVASEHAPLLNVSPTPLSNRLGGVQAQMKARLEVERTLRNVVLLRPGALEYTRPHRHARAMPAGFETALERALAITGASTLHVENTAGVALELLLRLAGRGMRLIVSVHDFSLFCERPNLVEMPHQRFCGYSKDLDRCHACLQHSRDARRSEQAERRAAGRALLEAASALVFPSQFLLERHRELFALPALRGEVIAPGVAGTRPAGNAERKAVAFAGNLRPHKGAHLLPEIVRHAGEGIAWHVFGGGDPALLDAVRREPGVRMHGYYRTSEIIGRLATARVGLVVVPSIFPETFSLVVSEAWLAGAAVVAFDHTAIAERIRSEGGGWVVPVERGAEGIADVVRDWAAGRITTTVPATVPAPRDAALAHLRLY